MRAARQSRRAFLRGGLALAGVGLLVGCGRLAPQSSQPARVPRIGFLGSGRPGPVRSPGLEAFKRAMGELGYVEGQHYALETRITEGRPERAPEFLAEFVQLGVDLIYTSGTLQALAAKRATGDIPIVVAATGDVVALGLVSSLARPGGNVTGVVTIAPQLSGKRIELLRQAVPRISRLGLLGSAGVPETSAEAHETNAAARGLGLSLEVAAAQSRDEIDEAFTRLVSAGVDGLLVSEDLYYVGRASVVEFAARHRLPAIYALREFVDEGGMMSYGPDFIDSHGNAAAHVVKILNGAKPADLPVEQPTTFDLVVNLKTAQALGITIPPSVLQQATEVIQ